jgi:hypothetical protein
MAKMREISVLIERLKAALQASDTVAVRQIRKELRSL